MQNRKKCWDLEQHLIKKRYNLKPKRFPEYITATNQLILKSPVILKWIVITNSLLLDSQP